MKLIRFAQEHKIYMLGYGVAFSMHMNSVEGIETISEYIINVIASMIGGLLSWCYPIAKLINSICGLM